MKAMNKKLTALTALLMAGLMLLCGCRVRNESVPEMTLSTHIPQKDGEEASFVASLYFLSDDGLQLAVEEREILYNGDRSRAEAAVQALIDGPEKANLRYSVPGDMALQKVETSYEACNVYLLASYTPEAREWLTARAAIAATVFACEDIAAVNLYLNGMTMGYYSRPMGAMQPITNALESYIMGTQQEYRNIYEGDKAEGAIYENRTATLYFADSTGTLLLAKNVTLNYDSSESREGIAAMLISKLMAGAEGMSDVLPDDFSIAGNISIEPLEGSGTLPDLDPDEGALLHPEGMLPEELISEVDPGMVRGEPSVMTINIPEPETAYDAEIMCGALTLTLTGYIPDIQGVNINTVSDGGRVASLNGDTYFTREDFSDMIGRMVYVVYPNKDGNMMRRVSRAMAGKDSYKPLYILDELFSSSMEADRILPELSAADIRDIYITGNTVVVDWKAGFEETLRRFIDGEEGVMPREKRERMFIYSVVNTLTELEGVSRVWMLEEGRKLGTVNEIYLGNALMRNPGITVDE